jgi:hypothetical protein
MFEKSEKKRQNKVRSWVILGLVVSALISAAAAREEENRNLWNVTLFGGGSFGQNGDAGLFIHAYDRYYQILAEAYGYSKSGSLDWPGAGLAFGGEIGYSLSSRLSVGLVVERLVKKEEGSFDLGSGDSHAMEMTLSAVSVSASGRYAVPLAKAVAVFFRARLGAIFGSIDRTLDRQEPNTSRPRLQIEADYSATGLTGQAGLGLEWDLSSRLSLQIEGGYRTASLPNWSGNSTYQNTWGNESVTERASGHLYYDEVPRDTERIPTILHPSLTLGAPEGHVPTTRRDFKADVTGFCCQLGLTFRFGRSAKNPS